MSKQSTHLIRHIRRLAAPAGEDLSDRQLLQRFVDRRDEEAFADLLRRHRPMVQGVGLRLLGNWQDAEDVAQATFLVLARRANTLRWQESAAGWLYRVAYHLALKVRAANRRRQTCERQTAGRTERDPLDDLRLREAQAVIDEELAALPERYRAPVLLCCLEAATRDEAARQLGWSLATLKRRLTKGRDLLRARLARRGLTLAAGLTPALFAPERSASAAIGAPSAQAVSLAEGALRAMTMLKLKITAALVLAAGVLSLGTGFSMWQGRSAAPSTPAAAPAAEQPKHTEAPSPPKDRYGDALPSGARARLGTVRLRHGSYIYGLDVSPDGRTLATSGGHGYVRLWNLDTGEELRSLHRENPWTTSHMVAFSPDGRTIATGSQWGVSLWQADKGRWLRDLEGIVTSLIFAPDGKTLATMDREASPSLWDVASGKHIARLTERKAKNGSVRAGVRSLAFTPDGRLLASTFENSIILWDMATRKEVRRLEAHEKPAHVVAFSSDGKMLASGGEDRTIRLWDVASGKCLHQLKGHEAIVTSLTFTPKGETLVSGSGLPTMSSTKERRALRLWDVASGEERGSLGEDGSGALSLVLTRNGEMLLSADGGSVRLWDMDTLREVRPRSGHHHWIGGIAFAPDGKRAVTGGGDGTVRLWDADTGRELRTFAVSAEVESVAFSPDGHSIAAGCGDGVIRLWDSPSGREVRQIRGHKAHQMFGVAFSPDGTQLASASRDATAAVWDAATGKELRRFKGDDGFLCVAFSPDGKRIATGEEVDKRHFNMKGQNEVGALVRVWDVTTGEQVHALPGHKNIMIHGVAFSPDGSLLASTSWNKTTCLWDMATGEAVARIPAGGDAVAFSPDGRVLATGDFDNLVRVWEVATRKERRRFVGHRAYIHGLAFSPDGRTLASGSMDSTALLWDLRGRRPLAQRADLEKHWQALAAPDAAEAYRAMLAWTAAPDQAIPLFRERIHAVRAPDPKRLEQLLADLDSERFAVREKAAREIASIGELARPALQKALEGKPSLEVRRRVEQLLSSIEPANSPETLRALRGVEVLENIGTAGACRVLQTLAQGAADARLTREAKAALTRIPRTANP